MIGVDVHVDRDGPIFSALRVHAAVDALIDEVEHDMAAAGLAKWSEFLDSSIRHPTPYYETQIHMERVGEHWSVNDRGVVYGPWLEGTGSRNHTTRFKGYAAARRARQDIEARVPTITAHALRRAVARLGG